ncbi:unnamed protein product [Moneuplotes crassus]|uniref:Uncharacterized protein n=1 Tax=Euplotes crassus TaxID=5936 RepID=A0AAD1X884_EUPCR|nr:unnamed protein product [Moneuplotes crassus]
MNFHDEYICDENLSEDLLSEGSPTSLVKVSERLDLNMKTTPFHLSRSRKAFSNSSKCVCPSKKLGTKSKGAFMKEKFSRAQPKSFKTEGTLLKFEKCQKNDEIDSQSSSKISLKSEISTLLRKSAQIRAKNLLSNPKSKKEAHNLEPESCVNKEEGVLYTFGNL